MIDQLCHENKIPSDNQLKRKHCVAIDLDNNNNSKRNKEQTGIPLKYTAHSVRPFVYSTLCPSGWGDGRAARQGMVFSIFVLKRASISSLFVLNGISLHMA